MSNTSSIKWIVMLITVITLVFGGGIAFANSHESAAKAGTKIIKFDVAEDMTRFVFDESVTFEDGLPAHGSGFVTQGYIYEYGTLDGTDGVLPNGDPEFPDKVIGEWTCWGYFVGSAAKAESGPLVITTQLYNFGDELGGETFVTEGYELADMDVAISRAVTGGTGKYIGATGEANQTLMGFNATEGVTLRFEVELEQDGPVAKNFPHGSD